MTFATLAFQKGKSSLVSMVGLINVVYAFLSDTIFFHISFTYIHIIGAMIITVFNVMAICKKKEEPGKGETNQEDEYI
jgi:drug/metabolite transporter (DMT)-like permease